ncbi:hypothetical protein V2J09_017727 [Rumex salicifolius]
MITIYSILFIVTVMTMLMGILISQMVLRIVLLPITLLLGGRWLYDNTKMRLKTERRRKFYLEKLRQYQLSTENIVQRTNLFTLKEMNISTEGFNDNRVLGKGGQGGVYKGILSDGRVVAIKKPKIIDESMMEEFVNEVVILFLTNHRHIVKLYGCCLNSKVPLLVDEFIFNGTLAQHIYHPTEDYVLTWASRISKGKSSISKPRMFDFNTTISPMPSPV